MGKLFTLIMYILWAASLIGILVITFQNFEYFDLNIIVGVLFFFTLLNTFFTTQRKRK